MLLIAQYGPPIQLQCFRMCLVDPSWSTFGGSCRQYFPPGFPSWCFFLVCSPCILLQLSFARPPILACLVVMALLYVVISCRVWTPGNKLKRSTPTVRIRSELSELVSSMAPDGISSSASVATVSCILSFFADGGLPVTDCFLTFYFPKHPSE